MLHACMQLPSADALATERTHRLDTTMYAHIMSSEVSSKLTASARDAALCAVERTAQSGGRRFCWVSVLMNSPSDASGAAPLHNCYELSTHGHPHTSSCTMHALPWFLIVPKYSPQMFISAHRCSDIQCRSLGQFAVPVFQFPENSTRW
jgi:hypothetical protein